MRFSQEILSHDLIVEMIPLLYKHYKEIAHYQDIELDPDYEQYLKIQELGMIRVFTARDEINSSLIGYSVFFVRNNLHYKNSKQAVQDILFLHPERRGVGGKLIDFADTMLTSEGVQVVYHHVKKEHNFGKLLERKRYELIDLIYGKRLDGK